MKKHINKIILILLVLNAVIIYFAIVRTSNKVQKIDLSDDNIINKVTIDYSVQGNPLSKIEVKDISNTNAAINSCVGSLGQSFDISGNFYNFQLKQAKVSMEYDEKKLKDVPEENIGILWNDKENGKMVIVDADVDTENNTISFNTEHFSEYILVDLNTWKEAWNKRVVKIRNEDSSFNIAFVIDDSGSMTSNDPKNLRLEATKEFIDILEKKDGFSVVKFESSAKVVQELTSDKDVVESLENNFKSSGGTNICSGVEEGIKTLENNNEKSKVIVLLTDGEDSGLKSKREELIKKALDKDIVIFTIFLNTGSNTNNGRTEDIERLAKGTGGEFYTINSNELVNIFKKISKVSVGVDPTTDTDKDGIPDEIELGGMKNKYAQIVYTNPYKADTDEDGSSDIYEIGEQKEENGLQYYDMVTDPATKNGLITESKIQTPSPDNEVWDSGFKLNKNAFGFDNYEVNKNGGVCYGISYVIENAYNKQQTKEKIINSANFDDHATSGYDVSDERLDIIFDTDKALPYFYYPKNESMKNKGNVTNSDFETQNPADMELTKCLYYYWIVNNIRFKNYFDYSHKNEKGKVENKIDEDEDITEDTITALKRIFDNDKIVSVLFYSKNFKHAVNAYALEKTSESEYRLYIYDNNCNYRDNQSQYIILTKVKGMDRYKATYKYGDKTVFSTKNKNNTENNFLAIEYEEEFINYHNKIIAGIN